MQEMEASLSAAPPASSTGVYLYCFARRAVADRIAGAGVDDDTQVSSLTVGPLAAIYSPVCRAAFSGPAGDAHLRDLSWVLPRAQRHEQIVETTMQLSPVLPARFGTVLSSAAQLERLLATNAAQVQSFLDQVTGKEEWSAKAFLDLPTAEAWLLTSQAPGEAPAQGPLAPGLRYIQSRRQHVHARQQFADLCHQTAEGVARMLTAQAVDVRVLRLSAEEGDKDKRPVFNYALLLTSDCVGEFRERASAIEAQYAERGLSLHISGPWPPYSFCPAVLDVEPCQ